jgi:hypothetical protein
VSRASYSRLDDDKKDPLPFQQLMEMHVPCRLSQWARLLEALDCGTHLGGKESTMTTLRFLMTAHFPAWRAAVTCYLERLNSAICDLVRSSSRKILLGRENNSLSSESLKSINCRPESKKESGVRPHPSSIKGNILDADIIIKK